VLLVPALGLLLAAAPAPAARALPSDTRTPTAYVNDWAGILTAPQRAALDKKLAAFEKDTAHQIVVALYEELPATPLEAFTLATANRWGVGQKGKDNGVVFFVFLNDKRMRLEVGLGLEKVLSNVKAQSILDDVVTPRFRKGDFAGGVEAAVDAVIQTLKPSPPR
jgi:uncharacterized protein